MTDAKPMTDQELDAIESRVDTEPITVYSCKSCGAVNRLYGNAIHEHVAYEIPRLVSEIRRLRQLIIDAERHVPDNEATRAMNLPKRLKAEVDRG